MITRLTTLFLTSSIILTVPAGPILANSTSQLTQATTFQFNPPKDGIPDNTTGGASRDLVGCRQQETATKAAGITLLAPNSFMGLTISEQPNFFLYAEQTSAKQLFFNVQNERGETIYQGYQALPQDTGLIKVDVPAEAISLVQDSTYRIAVVPVCEESLRPDDPILTAYIKRVNLPETLDSNSTTSTFDNARRYAASGIWYDTLVLLEQTLRHEPTHSDAITAWETLLSVGGLTTLN